MHALHRFSPSHPSHFLFLFFLFLFFSKSITAKTWYERKVFSSSSASFTASPSNVFLPPDMARQGSKCEGEAPLLHPLPHTRFASEASHPILAVAEAKVSRQIQFPPCLAPPAPLKRPRPRYATRHARKNARGCSNITYTYIYTRPHDTHTVQAKCGTGTMIPQTYLILY